MSDKMFAFLMVLFGIVLTAGTSIMLFPAIFLGCIFFMGNILLSAGIVCICIFSYSALISWLFVPYIRTLFFDEKEEDICHEQ